MKKCDHCKINYNIVSEAMKRLCKKCKDNSNFEPITKDDQRRIDELKTGENWSIYG